MKRNNSGDPGHWFECGFELNESEIKHQSCIVARARGLLDPTTNIYSDHSQPIKPVSADLCNGVIGTAIKPTYQSVQGLQSFPEKPLNLGLEPTTRLCSGSNLPIKLVGAD